MNKLNFVFIICFTIILTSCFRVEISDLSPLYKGMDYRQVTNYLGSDYEYEWSNVDLKSDKSDYTITAYDIYTGDTQNLCIFAFRDNKLIYWGWPHEFARSKNPVYNEIAAFVSRKLKYY